jgi:phospholipase D1/2
MMEVCSLKPKPLMSVRNIQQYDSFVTDTKVGHVADYSMPLEYVVRSLSNIRGHVVNMPLHYLEHEKLIAGGFNVNVNVVTGLIYPAQC